MFYQICDAMMSISPWDISIFEPQLIDPPNLVNW